MNNDPFKRIKDRGIVKWQGAFFIPEQVGMMKQAERDSWKQSRPVLDEYQIEEMESKIHQAMEYNLEIEVTVWEDGFEEVHKGKCHYLDAVNKAVRLVKSSGLIIISFADIIKVELVK